MAYTAISEQSPFYGIVDHVILQTCTHYRYRRDFMQRELARIGVIRYDTIIEHVNPLELYAVRSVNYDPGQLTNPRINCWFGHYHAMRISKDMGYDRVMLIEDDVAFLKDLDAIRTAVSEIALPFSVLHLDPVMRNGQLYASGVADAKKEGLTRWGRIPDGVGNFIHSTGCRILSAAAISAYVDFHERVFSSDAASRTRLIAADMVHCDIGSIAGAPVYYSVPNIAIQDSFSGHTEERGVCTPHAERAYRNMGIDVSAYSVLG